VCVIAWTVIHFTIILYPSTLSCFFRVNCDNDNVVRGATSSDLTPIQNPWNTTVMPMHFRKIILILCITNAIATCMWEYFVVNGFVAEWVKSFFPKENKLLGGVGYCGEELVVGEKTGMIAARDMEMVSVHPAKEETF
jgi:hypothetical protein